MARVPAGQTTIDAMQDALATHGAADVRAQHRERDQRDEATRERLKDTPVFEAVWEAIKGWDIERSQGEGYSGATGTDVGHVLGAIEPFLAPPLSDPDAKELGPFVRDSATSRRAALDTYPRQGSQRWRIIAALWRARDAGMTREQLEGALNLSGSTVRPRVLELVEGGWVRLTERERKTTTGSMAKVLELTEKGREEAGKRAEA